MMTMDSSKPLDVFHVLFIREGSDQNVVFVQTRGCSEGTQEHRGGKTQHGTDTEDRDEYG